MPAIKQSLKTLEIRLEQLITLIDNKDNEIKDLKFKIRMLENGRRELIVSSSKSSDSCKGYLGNRSCEFGGDVSNGNSFEDTDGNEGDDEESKIVSNNGKTDDSSFDDTKNDTFELTKNRHFELSSNLKIIAPISEPVADVTEDSFSTCLNASIKLLGTNSNVNNGNAEHLIQTTTATSFASAESRAFEAINSSEVEDVHKDENSLRNCSAVSTTTLNINQINEEFHSIQEASSVIKSLRRQLIEKDRLLIDTRLEALSVQHQLQEMEDSYLAYKDCNLDDNKRKLSTCSISPSTTASVDSSSQPSSSDQSYKIDIVELSQTTIDQMANLNLNDKSTNCI